MRRFTFWAVALAVLVIVVFNVQSWQVLVRTKLGEPGAGPAGSLSDMERTMLEDATRKAGGNKSKAAKLLGITRRMLYTKLERYGLATGDSPADE